MTYAVFATLSKNYYIEVWIAPVAILGLFTVAFAFLKIHDIPFLKYIFLIVEYSHNVQKRKWIMLGSSIKGLTAPRPAQKQKTKKEKMAEKTINSLSDVSKLLDRNTFEHMKGEMDSNIDSMSDKYLLHGAFGSKSEKELKAHEERLTKVAKNPSRVAKQEDGATISRQQLQKGNIEVQIPRK